MKILASSIGLLPNVESLDVSDNRLTDASLCKLIGCVKNMKSLKSINLGQNKIDSEASTMLRYYVQSSTCTLHELKLSKADVVGSVFLNLNSTSSRFDSGRSAIEFQYVL